MKVFNSIAGNYRKDPSMHKALEGLEVETLTLDQWTAQKSRFIIKSDKGNDYAVALLRHNGIADGDILELDPAAGHAVVAVVALRPVFVIDLSGVADKDPQTILTRSFELGHALGNQHWPAVVKGTKVYVPLTVDKKVMEAVMQTHAIEGVTYEFEEATDVIPYLAPHEIRRLFGGASQDSEAHHHHHHDHEHIH